MEQPSKDSEKWLGVRANGWLRFLLAVVVTTAGVMTAYHATIFGLHQKMSQKADQAVVIAIDQRLVRIETLLNERVATKGELHNVRDQLFDKLIALEMKMQKLNEGGQ